MKTFFGGIFIDKNKLKEANKNNPIKLEYYKVENEEEYGIEIVKTEYSNDKLLVEKEVINKFTNNEHIADNVLELFKRNQVTPISANEIIEDLLKM